jgi:hypothetical protein
MFFTGISLNYKIQSLVVFEIPCYHISVRQITNGEDQLAISLVSHRKLLQFAAKELAPFFSRSEPVESGGRYKAARQNGQREIHSKIRSGRASYSQQNHGSRDFGLIHFFKAL